MRSFVRFCAISINNKAISNPNILLKFLIKEYAIKNIIIKTGNRPYSTDIVKKPLCEVVISSYWDNEKSEITESNTPFFEISFPKFN